VGALSDATDSDSPSDSRVAVVVVAGVGDSPRGDAAERIANGLTLWADFDPPEEHSEWFKVSDHIQPVQRFATRSPGRTRVDLYEFWWADLSRFPAALRSFLAAFVGLFLAFPSIGRTALRDNDRVTEQPQPAPGGTLVERLDFHLLGLLAWLVSVPVVVLSATLLMSVGAVAVAVALPDPNSVTGALALGLYGSVLAIAGLGLLRHYEKQSGRSPAFGLGVLTLLAAAGICVWRLFERGIHGRSVELALADTVAELVAYPLRLLWLGILAVALTTALVLASRLIVAGAKRDERRARTVSAVITLGFGPLGIATLMAIFSAAVGAVGEKVGKAAIWSGAGGTPLCLAQPDDWGLEDCAGPITAWEFGSRLLADAIYSLAWATAVALGAVVVLGLAALAKSYIGTSSGDRADRQARRLTRMLGVLESPWTCALLLVAGGAATYAAGAAWLPFLPFIHPGESGSSWGPTVAAIMGGAVTTLLVAGRLMGLSPGNLTAEGKASGLLRAMLDKPYDIATFLREPLGSSTLRHGAGTPMPRKRMLERYRALMAYVERRNYRRVVFVAHSQGTILTATLLADDVPLRGEVSLMTFGCPLRQLYLKRFPSQYGWVQRLRDPATRTDFVNHVNGEWVNVAAAGDPVGRTVFRAPPEPWSSEGPQLTLPEGSPKLVELLLGAGGHSSYWTAPALYKQLKRLIEPGSASGSPG
jgi:hypothetical protein